MKKPKVKKGHLGPLSMNPVSMNPIIEIGITVIAIIFTLLSMTIVANDGVVLLYRLANEQQWGSFFSHGLFFFIIACLVYGGLIFLLTRAIYYARVWRHTPTSLDKLSRLFNKEQLAPPLTILVPSFKEEEKTVLQTLMSAALQQYPNKRVVLLIDNPPSSLSPGDKRLLDRTREIPEKIASLLAVERDQIANLRDKFTQRSTSIAVDLNWEIQQIHLLHRHVDSWLGQQAGAYPVVDHADRAYVANVFDKHRQLLNSAHEMFINKCNDSGYQENVERIAREYQRYLAIFEVEITSFERKQYENLSHEPNKAMNLNSYISLIGSRFHILTRGTTQYLERATVEPGDFHVPDAEFIITLDADSIVVPDYALRLVDVMKKKGNERLAVVQTPYSAFPGAEGALERVAGATTDMQYIIHQGFTGLNGTYWVGANALIRKTALEDIVTNTCERGHVIKRYIQDRTVIEDTESSVDLAEKGWQLFNYPERLAYSATPPDFGSLIIQRQRWANGGLIILPKLLRYFAKGPISLMKLGEAFVRIHYLASIAIVNVGLIVILAFPLATDFNSPWLPLTALGYFLLYARDLKRLGYQYMDLVRVYALNLLMIPVNLAGVFKSLQQLWTGEQIPFGRTPKVADRTATPAIFIVILCVLVANWIMAGGFDIVAGFWFHAVFAIFNAIMMVYAIRLFIGAKACREDLSLGLKDVRRRYVTRHAEAAVVAHLPGGKGPILTKAKNYPVVVKASKAA